jgi:hypothetical protein
VRLWIGTIERQGQTILDDRNTFSLLTVHDYGRRDTVLRRRWRSERWSGR